VRFCPQLHRHVRFCVAWSRITLNPHSWGRRPYTFQPPITVAVRPNGFALVVVSRVKVSAQSLCLRALPSSPSDAHADWRSSESVSKALNQGHLAAGYCCEKTRRVALSINRCGCGYSDNAIVYSIDFQPKDDCSLRGSTTLMWLPCHCAKATLCPVLAPRKPRQRGATKGGYAVRMIIPACSPYFLPAATIEIHDAVRRSLGTHHSLTGDSSLLPCLVVVLGHGF
jgi:hypothetical protein